MRYGAYYLQALYLYATSYDLPQAPYLELVEPLLSDVIGNILSTLKFEG